ncbi:phenylalanine--tRNA ligase, beta subunit [Neorickettsia helminthoeca str. Oregon]|uniref:Phenylalanine--tRNA ligase beta subunit n=1 Tax=Neorickettsia helminthoeca str. Oregon TaxID=1286528 RepID=X5HLQ2_9RICK|nr:phenylalanine--tRNA ligase subunit beta [Neorickettsia helminthoeca]AHX11350.1 phenylalanine--tRNA ligase, beta subunit [Neorickettsia helminthoeca str. Oregon]
MKFTFGWLLEHLDTSVSLEQIITALISLGFEVERCHSIGSGFVVARVEEVSKHPQADRLRLCRVSDGNQEFQIVCGAQNVRAGLKVVLACIGAVIPSNSMSIKKSKIRGCESMGMLCSSRELGLSEEDDGGILELGDEYEIGTEFSIDPLIEISVTPNRGDVLSIYGIARELAAAGYGRLIQSKIKYYPIETQETINFEIHSAEACSKFAGLSITGVKNTDSPEWLRKRLNRIGIRSVSALVDIVNYVMLSYGSPMHIYDADEIKGRSLSISVSVGERKCKALDGKEYTIPDGSIVIEDQVSEVHAIAGIIGAEKSECTLSTTNIFLEAAVFNCVNIALTRRKLKINTESAYRFERGVDPGFTETALRIAGSMIIEVCGGKMGEVQICDSGIKREVVKFPISFFSSMTGIEIEISRMIQILTNLGFEVTQNGKELDVISPSWRNDISTQACIAEEMLRVHGYDHLKENPLPNRIPVIFRESLEERIRGLMIARGFSEVITWSFMSERKCAEKDDLVLIQNPLGLEFNVMRPSIIYNLLDVAQKNHNNGTHIVRVFEIGRVYSKNAENSVISALKSGQSFQRNVHEKAHSMDFFDLKADLEMLFNYLNLENISFSKEGLPTWYHPGKAAVVSIAKRRIGFMGEIHPEISFGKKIVAFELYLDRIAYRQPSKESVFSKFPVVERDFSFVFELDKDPCWEALEKEVRSISKLIKDVTLFDRYEGDFNGMKRLSLAFLVTMENDLHSMSSEEIGGLSDKIIQCVEERFFGTLRVSYK